jgi:hypothetical protein
MASSAPPGSSRPVIRWGASIGGSVSGSLNDLRAVGAWLGHHAFRLAIGIYLRLTDLELSGYALLRSVCAMVDLITASGRDNGAPRRNRSDNVGTADGDLGVRPGESDSTPMVGAVLLVVLATIISVLGLVWWLT